MFNVFLVLIVLLLTGSQGLINPCRKGQTGNKFFPHPESENKYIHCSEWGQAFEFTCVNGLVFNPAALTCDRKDKMQFFQNFGNIIQSSNFESATRKLPRINPIFQTQQTTVNNELPLEATTKFFTFPKPVIQSTLPSFTITSTPRVFTSPQNSLPNRLPIEQSVNNFILPQTVTTTTPLITIQTIIPTTTKAFTPVTSTSTTTLVSTTTAANLQTNFQIDTTKKFEPFSSNDCDTFSISKSPISSVNGIYTKLNANLFRRSDDLKIPGLIVHLSGSTWCLTLTFFTADLNAIKVDEIESQCGPNLDCCMLISKSPDSLAITDPKREWIINILDFKGQKDEEISFDCKITQKICPRIPFCPPECLKNIEGCDVCECDGKPFFGFNSQPNTLNIPSQPLVTQSTTLPPLMTIPPSTLSANVFTTTLQSATINTNTRTLESLVPSVPPITRTLVASSFVQQNQNAPIFTTRSSLTQPSFTQPSFTQSSFTQQSFAQPSFTQASFTQSSFTQQSFAQPSFTQSSFTQPRFGLKPAQFPFSQRLSALKNSEKIQSQSANNMESFIVKSCDIVKCPDNLICAEANNCKNCNPMCFPERKFDLFNGVKLNCDNVMCGTNSTCVFDTNDKLLKCVRLTSIQPTQTELKIQALVNLHDKEHIEKSGTTSSSTKTTSTTINKINLVSNEKLANSNFTVRSCSMVKCPNDLMCAEAVNCLTCNPLCFPHNHFDLLKAVRLNCENVNCPDQMKCLFDTKETNLKCVV